MRRHVEENFDYVGDTFAREARAIHEGKSEDRGIYGEATPAEVKALVEDGVPVAAAAAGAAEEVRGQLRLGQRRGGAALRDLPKRRLFRHVTSLYHLVWKYARVI